MYPLIVEHDSSHIRDPYVIAGIFLFALPGKELKWAVTALVRIHIEAHLGASPKETPLLEGLQKRAPNFAGTLGSI